MAPESTPPEPDYLSEAVAAFAHEIRTPLTALHMAFDLAGRNAAADGSLPLDAEIAGLMRQSLEAMGRLVDDLQEMSRLQRGAAGMRSAFCLLPAAVEAARELLCPRITLEGPLAPPVEGHWEAARLAGAIAGFAEGADRMGDGRGAVRFETTAGLDHVTLRFASGSPGGAALPVASDAGFAFFHARQYVVALGGSVEVERATQFARVTATLPAQGG